MSPVGTNPLFAAAQQGSRNEEEAALGGRGFALAQAVTSITRGVG
jgi:hypothetical protein